jgi:hypothetical protein
VLVKHLQAMLDVVIVADPVYDPEDRDRGHDDDQQESLPGARPAASLHRRCAAEDTMETTAIYVTSSATEMHVAEFKAGAEIRSVKSKNSAMEGTMITMVLIMTNLTGTGHRKQDTSQDASGHTPKT